MVAIRTSPWAPDLKFHEFSSVTPLTLSSAGTDAYHAFVFASRAAETKMRSSYKYAIARRGQ